MRGEDYGYVSIQPLPHSLIGKTLAFEANVLGSNPSGVIVVLGMYTVFTIN